MPNKVFELEPAQDAGEDPITFTLAGVDRNGKPFMPVTFRCIEIDDMPGGKLVKVIKFTHRAKEGDPMAAPVMTDFLCDCVIPEQRDEFTTLIEDDDRLVRVELLGKISEYLMEVYGNRPTQASSNLPSTQSSSTPTSTVEPSGVVAHIQQNSQPGDGLTPSMRPTSTTSAV